MPALAAPYRQAPSSHYFAAAHQPAPQYPPHPQPAHHRFAQAPYKGHAMFHRGTQGAAEASKLIAAGRLSIAKDDLNLRMAAFSSALGILSALDATQTGRPGRDCRYSQRCALKGGGGGLALAAALAYWVAYLQGGEILTLADETRQRCSERLWQSLASLPKNPALRRGSHRHRVHGRRPAQHPRGPATGHGGAPSGQPW